MDRDARIVDAHPPCLDFVFGSTANGEAGGKEPVGGKARVEVPALLPAPNEVAQAVDNWAMPLEVFFGGHGGQMPQERVTGARCPAGVKKADQGFRRRRAREPSCIACRCHLSCRALDNGIKECLAGREMRVDRLPADPCCPGDVLDARLWLHAERFGCRLQDRGGVLLCVGPPTPSPGLGLR